MLDFSWSELMVVIVVAVLAVGPKQLPEVLHGMGKLFRRLQYMRYAVTRQFDDFMEQADLREIRDQTRIVTPDLFDEELADEEYITKPVSAAKPPEPEEAKLVEGEEKQS
ncbi:MAG: hypothetical protein DI586_06720 [Micavibrio aeruginosavorus]|uniref:Twin-arginine translocase subunit TatB n=1 Tax=Micavibrio aeruginosavorus TaxID=349221 RepID=A0A2W5FNV3_9BACT|nr:MAG: hypothetical protein DI586_06720 [Micavibrio aeruginosavorus]